MAPRLTEPIEIHRQTTVADTLGGRSVSWAKVADDWALVKSVRSREPETLGARVSAETFLVTVRYNSPLTAKDRVVWNGKTLNVSGVPQDREGTRRYLTVECEVGSGG